MQRDAAENSLPSQLFIHFGLRENPFGVTPDIRFLYQSHTHREALDSQMCIRDRSKDVE